MDSHGNLILRDTAADAPQVSRFGTLEKTWAENAAQQQPQPQGQPKTEPTLQGLQDAKKKGRK